MDKKEVIALASAGTIILAGLIYWGVQIYAAGSMLNMAYGWFE